MSQTKCACCKAESDKSQLCDDCGRRTALLLDRGFTPEKIAMGDNALSQTIRRAFNMPAEAWGWSVQRMAFK